MNKSTNKKAIAPTPTRPIDRIHSGQPSADANPSVVASEFGLRSQSLASYDGDEE
ncbi:microcyclamide/patellamide family RiPP [Lyngbya sp. CCY1209]|uniref:microcyclamide/patellamide family RiPP n=1 Tax=Lyngbya sp. CCY1209 TaxID=2886103 RepID=UPI002D2041F0|nr:microcyclamide/patellamide family RiPP [Lyngbya sp. CCY1209]MEB3883428.1 microcyclamide/patellamide family RiPP [Lyngbya sp. CCY1209]